MTQAKEAVEQIVDGRGKILAVIVRSRYKPEKTSFITPDSFVQQLGFVVYKAGGKVAPHLHLPLERQVRGTCEAVIVRQGRSVLRIFDDKKREVHESVLEKGDVVLLVKGGHGFEMLEDTILMEVKQGPYTGLQEKEHF